MFSSQGASKFARLCSHFPKRLNTVASNSFAQVEKRPPVPPFTRETAIEKVRLAENAWNSRDPKRISLAYTPDSWWRNRDTFVQGREAIVELLTNKWKREKDYKLIKELWAYTDNKISVKFQYEWNDGAGNWFRSHGNEQWDFDENGLMRRREASINDVPIKESERKFLWSDSEKDNARPANYPGLTELGL